MTALPKKHYAYNARPQENGPMKEHLERDPEKEIWTASFRYVQLEEDGAGSTRHSLAGWRQVVCGLCVTETLRATRHKSVYKSKPLQCVRPAVLVGCVITCGSSFVSLTLYGQVSLERKVIGKSNLLTVFFVTRVVCNAVLRLKGHRSRS